MDNKLNIAGVGIVLSAILTGTAVWAEIVDCSGESAFAVFCREGENMEATAKTLEAKIAEREGKAGRPVSLVMLPKDAAGERAALDAYAAKIRGDDEVKRVGALVTPSVYATVTSYYVYKTKLNEARKSPLYSSRHMDSLEFPVDGRIADATLDYICGYRIDSENPVCAFENGDAPMTASEVMASLEAGEWVDEEMAKTKKQIAAWQGKDQVVLVAFECDLHAYAPPRGRWTSREELLTSAKFRHIKRFVKVANTFGVDAAAELGDLGYDYSGRHWKASCRGERVSRMALQRTAYELFEVPFMAVPGNHDHYWDSADGFGRFFNPEGAKRIAGFVLGPTRSYGYYDLKEKRTRLFYINTSERGTGGGWMIGEAQVEFMRKAVESTPDGWTVAFFGHDCLHRTAGSQDWKERPGCKKSKTYCEMRALLESIASGKRLKLAGIFCGDSHMERLHEENGVRYFICDGAFKCNGERKMLVNIAAMKPATGEAKLFRVGVQKK